MHLLAFVCMRCYTFCSIVPSLYLANSRSLFAATTMTAGAIPEVAVEAPLEEDDVGVGLLR